jgi:hypothetical protein
MGSFLSGRWGWHTKRETVEQSRTLDLGALARHGAFRHGYTGSVRWSRGETETDSIGFTVYQEDDGLVLTLRYAIKQNGENVEIPIPLETTKPGFGGARWWGRCPCGRRVLKLYITNRSARFACRVCHDLTYKSVQEHDKRVDALRKNPEAVSAILDQIDDNRPSSKLLLALKAMR